MKLKKIFKESYKSLFVGGCSTLLTIGIYHIFADTLGFRASLVAFVFAPIRWLMRFIADKYFVFKPLKYNIK